MLGLEKLRSAVDILSVSHSHIHNIIPWVQTACKCNSVWYLNTHCHL
jgi:hypothetical protein